MQESCRHADTEVNILEVLSERYDLSKISIWPDY
jgi:hypothetical protein